MEFTASCGKAPRKTVGKERKKKGELKGREREKQIMINKILDYLCNVYSKSKGPIPNVKKRSLKKKGLNEG